MTEKLFQTTKQVKTILLLMSMMGKFLSITKQKSKFQSYTGETVKHDKEDSENQVVDEETLTHAKL